MPEMSMFWLRVAAALYSVGLVHAILTVLRRETKSFPLSFGFFCVGVILHVVAVVERGVAVDHLPADNFYESISLCALLVALVFLFAHWRWRFSSLAVFLFPLVFLMTLVGATQVPVEGWTNQRVRNAWLLLHVMLVLIGYSALLLTAVASICYLIHERRLKTKRPSGWFENLPPLGTLDDIITRSMGAGFAFITLAVVAGVTWGFIESGTRWIAEAKVVVSLITWFFYLVMVFLRTSAGWRGRKAAVMALCVLGFSAITWATHAGLRPLLEK